MFLLLIQNVISRHIFMKNYYKCYTLDNIIYYNNGKQTPTPTFIVVHLSAAILYVVIGTLDLHSMYFGLSGGEYQFNNFAC